MKEVIWCERGWQPVNYGFCPSKKAWHRELKLLGVPSMPYPDTDGRATVFTKDGKVRVLVTVRDGAEKQYSLIEVIGLLVHEGTHVWQEVRAAMGEHNPSIEFEAYSMQAIVQELMAAFKSVRKLPAT